MKKLLYLLCITLLGVVSVSCEKENDSGHVVYTEDELLGTWLYKDDGWLGSEILITFNVDGHGYWDGNYSSWALIGHGCNQFVKIEFSGSSAVGSRLYEIVSISDDELYLIGDVRYDDGRPIRLTRKP